MSDVRDAISVVLEPIDYSPNVDEDFTNLVKKKVIGRSLEKGDMTSVTMLGHPMRFHVYETEPKGKVKVVQSTTLKVLSKSMRDRVRKEKTAKFREVKSFGKNLQARLEKHCGLEMLWIRVIDAEGRYVAETFLSLEEIKGLSDYLEELLKTFKEIENLKC